MRDNSKPGLGHPVIFIAVSVVIWGLAGLVWCLMLILRAYGLL